MNIGYHSKLIEEVEAYKFHGLQSGNSLDWKRQIEYIIPKLIAACFAIRAVNSTHGDNMVKLIYSLISTPWYHMG